MGLLDGKRVIVTGASRGLGDGIVKAISELGARVFGTDTENNLAKATETGSRSASAQDIYVSEIDQADAITRKAAAALGGIDALVCCHSHIRIGAFLQQSRATWWEQLNINLRATFTLSQAVLPYMQGQGHGQLIFVGSEAGATGARDTSAYSAACAGLASLTKTMGRELGPLNILTNVIAPSFSDSLRWNRASTDGCMETPAYQDRAGVRKPIVRRAEPEEIARTVVYLLGPFGGSIVGQIINVNGGSFRGRV